MFAVIKKWSGRIKRDVVVLWFARKHPETPFVAKVICVVAVLYVLSPIDLIPDFIPVLGYLDDIVLVPALIWLVLRMLPSHVLMQCRQQADDLMQRYGAKPKSYAGAVLVVLIWCVLAYVCWRWLAGQA